MVASGVGAVAGGALAATAGTVASVASGVATAASLGSQLLQKKPPARGGVNQVTIGANEPIPYSMGRCFVPGTQEHDVGYGGTVDDVRNPYLSKVFVHSAGGPIDGFESYLVDWLPLPGLTVTPGAPATPSGYYGGWLHVDVQLGARPEAAALSSPYGAIPDWGASHKLSGYAATLVTMRFDKKGKVWANGVPAMGPVARWARVYDPRLDTDRDGGEGTHDYADEDTFEYDPNAALNALTYARGRFAANGAMVVGCGFPEDTIDWPAWIAWANVCTANGWEANGTVWDGPGISRWDNLKRICLAGAAVPCFSGGLLSVKFQSPKVALDTITAADLADGEYVVPGMRTYRDRVNSIVPKFRSEANKWELVQSAAIGDAGYLAEDGGDPKEEEIPYELVTAKDQAAELGAYELVQRRELTGITLPLKPRMWGYRLGEAIYLDLPDLGLEHLAVIAAASKDVSTGIVTLTFETETSGKHAFALGQTGSAPPAPTLFAHGTADEVASTNPVAASAAIRNTYLRVTGDLLSAEDAGDGTGTVTIADHSWDYPNAPEPFARTGGAVTGLDLGTRYYIYFDDATLEDDAPTYEATTLYAEALNSGSHPYRHFLDYIDVPALGGGPSTGGGGGGGYCPTTDMQLLERDRGRIAAGDVAAGDMVWARHEVTGEWGWYEVEAATIETSDDIWALQWGGNVYRCTGNTMWWIRDGWRMARALGTQESGSAPIVKITVAGARTYLVFADAADRVGLLSHNIKQIDPI